MKSWQGPFAEVSKFEGFKHLNVQIACLKHDASLHCKVYRVFLLRLGESSRKTCAKFRSFGDL